MLTIWLYTTRNVWHFNILQLLVYGFRVHLTCAYINKHVQINRQNKIPKVIAGHLVSKLTGGAGLEIASPRESKYIGEVGAVLMCGATLIIYVSNL